MLEQIKSYKYKVRSSYLAGCKHLNDGFKNLGYDYYGKILKKNLSPEMYANPSQQNLYGAVEGLITFLFEQVKSIKKTFSIAHDKDSVNIN